MPLDNKVIETLSVNAVKNSIVMSDFLDQFIADNDKEPSWDGFVYIYGERSKEKSKLKGRMPVQVKGVNNNDHSNEVISYSMSTVDLRNYLNDGGCVLFVVYIGNCGMTNKIYYAELTPVKLKRLLKEAGIQGYKTIHLKEFPVDGDKKANIFLNCLQNCQKQASFKDGELRGLKELRELKEQGMLENIVVPVSSVGETDPQMELIKNEVYLYAQVKGSSIPQPFDIILQDIQTHQTIDALVTIDDRVFYTNFRIIRSVKRTTICYGDSLKVIFDENSTLAEINYKNSDKIRILARDLDFMLNFLEKGYFKVDDNIIPFDYDGMKDTNFDKVKERELLSWAQEIVRILDALGCADDIDVNDMKDADWKNLFELKAVLLDKKTIKGLKKDLPSAASLKVGKLRFAISFQQCKEKGSYEVYDFFNLDHPILVEDKNNIGKMIPVFRASLLHENDFLTLSNMNFDILLPEFQKTERCSETFNRATEFLLRLLNAYDIAEEPRKTKILNVCKAFIKWMEEASDEELEYSIKMLNILQTVKRYRNLNRNEIEILYSIAENKEVGEACKAGAYLLLEQQQAAEIHLAKLSKEEQEKFKKYPIYHLGTSIKNP